MVDELTVLRLPPGWDALAGWVVHGSMGRGEEPVKRPTTVFVHPDAEIMFVLVEGYIIFFISRSRSIVIESW